MSEELTAEEQEAMTAMQEDPVEPVKEEVKAEEPQEPKEEPKEETPEFKSTRQEEDTAKPPEGYVPHQAMHAERVKRQEIERELQELRQWKEAQEAPKEEPPQFVDPLEDPEGFRKYQEYQNKQNEEWREQQRKAQEQTHQHQKRISEAARLEQEFAAKTTDYPDAAKFLHDSRIAELRQQGLSDAEISNQIRQDANALFDAASAMQMNPAQLLYFRAQAAGYKNTPAAAPEQPSDAAKMEALAAAQKETQGLGSTGGEQSSKPTAQQIADMSEDEIAKMDPADLAAAFGG